MNIDPALALHLLHRCALGTLATHARDPQGFPYPTVVPFAPDASHRPLILVSGLAEHTRNLAADPRAGFLVVDAPGGDVLNAERATLLGRFVPLGDDPHVTARYCRYEPDAARYLALGDFTFWALDVERLRYIGGFGRMGWVDGTQLDALPPLAFDEEQALWDAYDAGAARRDGLALLGVDRHGADWRYDGRRVRTPFDSPLADAGALRERLIACARDVT
ncbi:pyridoxamine 5'-phosphate oxidase [Burkholderia aenigmatica]|uniref:Pyridoxamine 5'-phosphate oxidase n=1 Tax=Burkholderia aenigmatica TaxID=2015348 RepID=A0A6P2NWT2_9BURK|nr:MULTISPECIES: pyridoxamine 5'-phosphate oxidase family protein [Burkholderia]MDN7518107.1 pyridoxamine 5'-phosphate oxidase family protein [Burkholderia sp. AU45251]VWB99339.1 pyridoxamine 5'-phosphate oxidase [Burkholderia aenigmatica]HDR9485532.1 pyridoxamine 5'-phosphate oxidase family protein [Burkholderia aenigmatica]HDR9520038.1 pyridoxamine 5'-phosphate oxidase family protein [Burkholderia aenigmatica]HDR9597163.1 pyridoxamine 5'-phosphate oxidase family protein [Burkholderia aenigma